MNKEIKFERDTVWDEYIKVKGELVGRLKQEAKNEGEEGVFWEIVGGGNEVTMGIGSNGCWEGLAGTRQWVIGKNPSMARLLSNYALASDDEGYMTELGFAVASRGRTDRLTEYLEEHKDRLMLGLIEEMQLAISDFDERQSGQIKPLGKGAWGRLKALFGSNRA